MSDTEKRYRVWVTNFFKEYSYDWTGDSSLKEVYFDLNSPSIDVTKDEFDAISDAVADQYHKQNKIVFFMDLENPNAAAKFLQDALELKKTRLAEQAEKELKEEKRRLALQKKREKHALEKAKEEMALLENLKKKYES